MVDYNFVKRVLVNVPALFRQLNAMRPNEASHFGRILSIFPSKLLANAR